MPLHCVQVLLLPSSSHPFLLSFLPFCFLCSSPFWSASLMQRIYFRCVLISCSSFMVKSGNWKLCVWRGTCFVVKFLVGWMSGKLQVSLGVLDVSTWMSFHWNCCFSKGKYSFSVIVSSIIEFCYRVGEREWRKETGDAVVHFVNLNSVPVFSAPKTFLIFGSESPVYPQRVNSFLLLVVWRYQTGTGTWPSIIPYT